MKYSKPSLTLEKQVDLLIQKGMTGDRAFILNRLRFVSYYRRSGYWHPFKIPNSSQFKPGTEFIQVWERYVFDRRLRLLAMDAVERLEVAVRTQLANIHSLKHGPFGYTDPATLPKLTPDKYQNFMKHVDEETARSRETFVSHFKNKYGADHPKLPVWMATEVMPFGGVLSFFRGADQDAKREIAASFGVPDIVLESWLLSLNSVRNICAHHGRLWNREFGIKPKLPNERKHPEWYHPVPVGNSRLFALLTICRYALIKIAPQSHWPNRLMSLLQEYPKIPLISMGFPANWLMCPLWAGIK